MKIRDMNWSQVENYLRKDDRAVLPIGSTEQHAQLSLCVDYILSERVAVEAAEPLQVPVFPGLPYGVTPYFMGFPGTVSIKVETYINLIRDILDSLVAHGFKRIVIVNGHGGNSPAQAFIAEWIGAQNGVSVKFHNWWSAPATWKKVVEIDPVASHASWMENFPWTRLADVQYPQSQKPKIDPKLVHALPPPKARDYIGDGNYGGYYQRSDKDMLELWRVGVEETREVIANNWP
ncbi:MAG: creatininase family protein [Gammaproteobacteria bacterium]|nr:creatininase family protein [Gammaproteobacteria bacterium]